MAHVGPEALSVGFAIDPNSMFSDHKQRYRSSIERRQRKLARKLPDLGRFLGEQEQVLLITTGCSPMSVLEQVLTGHIIIYIKRAVLVFTNKRILHIPTRMNYAYRNSIAQIWYADCQSIRLRWRTLSIAYKNGKKEKFYYVSHRERRKIKELLKTIALEGSSSLTQPIVSGAVELFSLGLEAMSTRMAALSLLELSRAKFRNSSRN